VKDDHVMAMGGLEKADLAFEGIRLTLDSRKNKKNGGGPKQILDGSIRARARPGRMLALMGPSGKCTSK